MRHSDAVKGWTPSRLVTICFTLLLSIAVLAPAAPAQAAPYSAIVVDAESGRVLHAQNADDPRFPASLTKMMTIHMAFDAIKAGRLRLDQQLTVSSYAAGQAPSVIGLRPGQKITVRELILAGVTKSANDAMVVLAEGMGGTTPKFAEMMTTRARALGMSRTTFRNPNGLPDPHQKTTARDMATLAQSLLTTHRDYYHYFSTPEFEWNDKVFANHNRLLQRYQGVDGIKTGFIRASGFNLVASAKRDGRRVIGVVFGGTSAPARDARMVQLLDMAFDTPVRRGNEPMMASTASDGGGFGLISSAQAAEVSPRAMSKKERQAARKADAKAKLDKASLNTKPASTAAKSGGKSSWAVQLGAFRQPSAAEAVLAKAQPRVPAGEPSVEKLRSDDGPLFRARLVGLSETDARSACDSLKRRNLACTVVSPTAG
ncbi:serine hydrolase [Ferrovibrio sp.]|uniref:serine hydrolase n=1 Tax=Ferrovibrio sp. TaxID=1917215 RepID=UPI0035AE0DAC